MQYKMTFIPENLLYKGLTSTLLLAILNCACVDQMLSSVCSYLYR